jgi:glycosyltransferase involved in cell wall biosynthesis
VKTIVFLEQQSWLGGAQRVLEATIEAIGRDYECIAAFPEEGTFRRSLQKKGIETVDLPIGHYRSGRKSVPEMVRFVCRSVYCGLRLAQLVHRRQIALVYINGPRCLLAGVLAAALTRRPAIFHLHLILERKPEVLLVRALSRKCSAILACSHAAALSLYEGKPQLAARTQVVYNPLLHRRETAIARRSTEGRGTRKQWTIGVVGRVTESKGHHLLLQAVAALPDEIGGMVRILVVGAGAPDCEEDFAYSRRLRTEAHALGVDGQILWLGYQADPRPFYASMDVLVHPALVEGMCIAILEALDSGVPVIAFHTGGIPEVVRDGYNGMLVSSKDHQALSSALKLFFEKRELRESLRSGARCGLDRRFSMEAFFTAIRTVVEDVLSRERLSETHGLAERAER